MAAPPLLRLDHIALTFGGEPLLRDVNLSLGAGERIALVGRNGCGKSTLLKIAAGLSEAQGGEIFRQPGATIRYLPQMPDLAGFDTVLAYVEAGLGPVDDVYRAISLIENLDLDSDAHPATLSGGQLRRAALARILGAQPDILLLDEPTNHLDLAVIEWLEGELGQSRSAAVIVSHDRRFLENISRTTLWIDRGISHQLGRGFAHFESWRDEILAQEERQQHNLAAQILREEHWLRYGVTARRKRNVRRLAELQDLRARQQSHQGAVGQVRMVAHTAETKAKLVIEAKSIAKSYHNKKLVDNFSLRIHYGDRIGLIGRNGAGKTTLLSMLIGSLKPDSGQIRFGYQLEPAILDQNRRMDETQTLESYLTDGRGDTLLVKGQERHVVSYMKDFLFAPEQKRTPLVELSGGERARLMLARLLAKPANLLVLDEPTNDLDMETLDLLQELIASFAGTVLLVSHDRDFLDRCVTSIIAAEGDGRWIPYAGGYSDMMQQRRLASTPAQKTAGQKTAKGTNSTVKPTTPTAPAAKSASKQVKLSFKQQHRLSILPQEIEQLSKRLGEIEEAMAAPELYIQDAARFHALSDEFSQCQTQLAQCEEEWLELEMLREQFAADSNR